MKLFKAVLPLAAMLMAVSSCSLDEPSAPEGPASQMRISAVTSFGVTLMKWDYDPSGRIVKIRVGDEVAYDFTYTGDSKTPSEIEARYYDFRDDNEARYIETLEEWTDIQANSNGCIVSYNNRETDYDYNNGMAPTVTESKVTLTYDAHGQLTHISDHYFDEFTNRWETDVQDFNWTDGLLMSMSDRDGLEEDVTRLSYSDVDNPNRQWDPNNEILGPMATTGFFGVGPVRFPASASVSLTYGETDVIQYSYLLLPNGLIRMSKVKEEGEATIVMNYIYEKI